MLVLASLLSTANAVEVFPFVAQHRTLNLEIAGSAVKLGVDLYATSCHNMVDKDHAQVLENRRRNFVKMHAVGASDICFLGDGREWTVSNRQPVIGEKITVIGFVGTNVRWKSEGRIIFADDKEVLVDAPWEIGVSGGAIVGSDGALLALATYMPAAKNYYVGMRIYPELRNAAESINVRNMSTSRLTLYSTKSVTNMPSL